MYISVSIYIRYIRLLKNAVNHKVGCFKFKHTCLFSFVHALENMTSSKTTTFQGNKQIHLTSFIPIPWKKTPRLEHDVNVVDETGPQKNGYNLRCKQRGSCEVGRVPRKTCSSVMCDVLVGWGKSHHLCSRCSWNKTIYIEAVCNSYQLMVNWWFGARWFGIRIGVPLSINSFHFRRSQESKPPSN